MGRRLSQNKQRGIVMVAVCLSMLLMLAGIGFGVDLNRFLAAREALTARAEGAALAAVLELDGTAEGLERARIRAADSWAQGGAGHHVAFSLEFAPSGSAGPWGADPVGFADLRAARVRARIEVPLTILRSVVNQRSLPAAVAARAEQRPVEVASAGLLPWTVALADTALPGTIVRLSEMVTVDASVASGSESIQRGVPGEVRIGDRITEFPDPTPKLTREALRKLSASDSDPVSATYTEYQAQGRGNGRRIVLLPLVDRERHVTGFGAFLLRPAEAYQDDTRELRVEFAGSHLQGSRYRAAAAKGAWRAEVVSN